MCLRSLSKRRPIYGHGHSIAMPYIVHFSGVGRERERLETSDKTRERGESACRLPHCRQCRPTSYLLEEPPDGSAIYKELKERSPLCHFARVDCRTKPILNISSHFALSSKPIYGWSGRGVEDALRLGCRVRRTCCILHNPETARENTRDRASDNLLDRAFVRASRPRPTARLGRFASLSSVLSRIIRSRPPQADFNLFKWLM